jgi:hypothetical protein
MLKKVSTLHIGDSCTHCLYFIRRLFGKKGPLFLDMAFFLKAEYTAHF